jgi:hypothetical protein
VEGKPTAYTMVPRVVGALLLLLLLLLGASVATR